MKARVLVALGLCCLTAVARGAGDSPDLVTDVWKASGGENWPKVKRLRFTFEVESAGQKIASAKHDWDVSAGTDHVQWKDKEGKDHDVTVDLKNPPQDGEGKKGYARWVNDSYWLIAPLKLRDPGVTATPGTQKEFNGAMCDTLRLQFANVGLTPSDQYLFYIDPQTKLLRAWDYIPKEGGGFQATWDNYQKFGGLMVATEHRFNDKAVKFSGVEVVEK